jgi:hypothetical protein
VRSRIARIALLFLAAVATAAEREDAGIPVIAARVVNYEITPRACPLTVVVTVANPSPVFTGTLEACAKGDVLGTVFEQAVNLGRGRFSFFLYPQCSDAAMADGVAVRLRDEKRRVVAEDTALFRRANANWCVAMAMQARSPIRRPDWSRAKVSVVAIREPDGLPDRWHAYRAYDALLWDGCSAPARLEPAQRGALTDWIRAGGRLVMCVGTNRQTSASPLPELTAKASFAAADSSVALAEARVGLGSIALLFADYTNLDRLDSNTVFGVVGRGAAAADRALSAESPGFHDRSYGTLPEPSLLVPVLGRMSGFRSLRFVPFASVILAYILAVSLGDYWILRRLRKLPWTWLSFPCLIAAFSAAAFLVFYKGPAQPLVRQEIRFHDVAPDGSRRMTVLGCVNNKQDRPVILALPPSHAMSPLFAWDARRGYSRSPARERETARVTERVGGGVRSLVFPSRIGSYVFFQEEWVEERGRPPLVCDLRKGASGLTGHVRPSPDGGTGLVAAFVWYGDSLFDIKDGQLQRCETARPHDVRGEIYKALGQNWTEDVRAVLTSVEKIAVGWIQFGRTLPERSSRRRYAWNQSGESAVNPVLPEHARLGDAVVFAMGETGGMEDGMRFHRIECVRQIVRPGGDGSQP